MTAPLLRPLWAAATWLERSERTLRNWYNAGLLEHTACDVATRAILVDLVEVQKVATEHPPRRNPRHADRQSRGSVLA